MKIATTVLSIFLSCQLFAQRQEIISPSNLMEIGSYYYPEQWPENEWERDIKKMKDLGFEFTHFGEFAWSSMEPEEGKYDFAWLDKSIALAAKYNLKVILCTPTPTPPAWFTHKYPESLIVNAEGRTIRHGARQHVSWDSDIYRQYTQKIIEAMAKRYANNKTVWGWQIDNEPSHYGSYDYSANAQKAFRQWLKTKYKTIDNLNKVWGNAFWSQTYNNFEQVNIPNSKELVQQANPHAILDFKRYTADSAANFVLWQQDILRKYIPANQWVTTNLMVGHSIVDAFRFGQMDFVTYTKYLVAGGDMGHGAQGFRIGNSTEIGISNDWTRSINGITGVMELQPGQVNWGRYNPQPMPGAVRMWIYHALAGNNKFVCNYRFRQPLTGGEQYHYGIMQTDGVSVSTSGDEYIQVVNELKQLRKLYDPKAIIPKEYNSRKTAILYSADSRWETEYQAQTNQWSYMEHLRKYYKILQSFAAPVDIIAEPHEFDSYPVVIAPAYQLLDKELISGWKNYVTKGGHLVLTCRTGQKNREAHLWNEKLSAPIYELIGAKSLFFDMLPESVVAEVSTNAKAYKWNNWADIVEPTNGTEVWATYTDQFYKGKAAVTSKKIGQGTVTFIGVDTDNGELEKEILRKTYQNAGINIEDLPEGVVLEWRHGFWIAMNYSSEKQTINIPSGARIVIGQKTLQPADVVVWKQK